MNLYQVGLYSLGLIFYATSVRGEIIPDGSLSTDVQKNGNVTEITGGKQAGGNLFHSFQEFSVQTNSTALFNNGIDIDNILSRVTGENISHIDGLIRANGNANLFLINPAGIIFGENARLDLGGSFLGSTATGLLFDDGTEFHATSNAIPALTINAPIGLNLRDATGNIESRGILTSNDNLTLAADNLDLQGQLTAESDLTLEALNYLKVRDSINNSFIASAGNNLSLQGNKIDILALNNFDSGLFSGGNLILRSDRPIIGDAHYYSGGNFRIEQLNGTPGNLISVEDPIVRSQGDVSLGNYTGASLHILAGGKVAIAGDITITGVDTTANSLQETVSLSNGNQININGNAQPTLDIRAGTRNSNPPGITGEDIGTNSTDVPTGSDINIDGTVSNPGGQVFLTNQYQPNNELTDGNITVTAINTSNNLGNGGNLTIDGRQDINIPNGINTSSLVDSQLVTIPSESLIDRTITSGNGGDITLLATENIITGDVNTGSSINLNLITEVDSIEEANLAFAAPFANLQIGRGGDINIHGGNDINTENITSSSALTINSNSTALDSFSIISVIAEFNLARGGNINLNADNNITTQNINSQAVIRNSFTSSGETTPEITLSVSEITFTIAQGNVDSGGNIFLEAGDRVNTNSLNSSVAIITDVDNSTNILANNPNTATPEQPSRAFSTVDILYENINLGRGGTVNIKSDRANVGDVNTSISLTSNSSAFAQANAENNAAADSFANNKVNLTAVGDRPGVIIFDVDQNLSFTSLNSSTAINATNNLDSQARSQQGDNSIANASTSDRFGNDSINQIILDSDINFAFVRFNLNPPDVNYVVSNPLKIPSNPIQPVDFDAYPINSNKLNRSTPAIETAQGKIYPARGISIENGQLRLTSDFVND